MFNNTASGTREQAESRQHWLWADGEHAERKQNGHPVQTYLVKKMPWKTGSRPRPHAAPYVHSKHSKLHGDIPSISKHIVSSCYRYPAVTHKGKQRFSPALLLKLIGSPHRLIRARWAKLCGFFESWTHPSMLYRQHDQKRTCCMYIVQYMYCGWAMPGRRAGSVCGKYSYNAESQKRTARWTKLCGFFESWTHPLPQYRQHDHIRTCCLYGSWAMPGRRAGSGGGKYTMPRAPKRAAKGSNVSNGEGLCPSSSYISMGCCKIHLRPPIECSV